MKIVARIYTGFVEKFGIPRQSGLAEAALGRIVFEPEYRVKDALRGIDGYSHLWLIWKFSEAEREEWSPTVRPPRLGGNKKMGVFATRSPYRPNPIGLSSVRLVGVEETENEGTVLIVSGADILSGTPIYDIKPYLAFTDSHPDAVGGFADGVRDDALDVDFPEELLYLIPDSDKETVTDLLRGDPRPHYQSDPERVYGMIYGKREIFFKVDAKRLTVVNVKKR
ncbi:MAG: tRNA (N6-threonylcarbamoyladenosine(37)-N6)-methyltransferase TrmO [Clostridia bacterium]|nr:tRNA (N6-threonylcarbamoyladenosine(37)-N6)-methyltransferase TrmO [Clostridia bacterium]